jgi:hypothetical protein
MQGGGGRPAAAVLEKRACVSCSACYFALAGGDSAQYMHGWCLIIAYVPINIKRPSSDHYTPGSPTACKPPLARHRGDSSRPRPASPSHAKIPSGATGSTGTCSRAVTEGVKVIPSRRGGLLFIHQSHAPEHVWSLAAIGTHPKTRCCIQTLGIDSGEEPRPTQSKRSMLVGSQ